MIKHVLKFGGTCLGNKYKYKWILNEIQQNYIKQNIFPIIVVSAISSKTKKGGTTSNLINCLSSTDYRPFLNNIKNDHLELIQELKLDHTDIYNKISPKFKEIELLSETAMLFKSNMNDSMHNTLYENTIKLGEDLSAEIITTYLNDNGIQTKYLNFSNIIPNYPSQTINIQDTNITNNIYESFNKFSNEVSNKKYNSFVTSGYIGNWGNYGGILNILNRGYTDYTSAMVSKAIQADKMVVYKESSAIFTLNPTKYNNAKIIDKMSFDELILLTNAGNEALHKNATNILKKENIPITIRNAFNNIVEKTDIYSYNNNNKVVALTEKNCYIIYVPILSNEMNTINDILIHLDNLNNSIQINAISYTQKEMSIIISGDIDKLSLKNNNTTITSNKKFISIIGNYMNNNIGIASNIFYNISKLGININNIIQTNSENCISFVVDETDSDKILETLHDIYITHS